MRSSLWWLLLREALGPWRALRRRPFSSRGLAVLALAGIAGWLALTDNTPRVAPLAAREGFRAFAPFGILALAALGLFAPSGLHFRAPELALLHPAPLRPRELVLFNLLSRSRAVLLSAVFLALLPSLRGPRGLASFLGLFFALLFVQSATLLFATLRAWLAQRRHTAARHALWIGAAALALVAAAIAGLGSQDRALAWLSASGQLTRPFVELMLAPSLASAAPWLLACAALCGLLSAGVVALGAATLEASYGASLAAQRRRARMRAGGVFAASAPSTRLRAPQLPRLAGAGPLAWRQWTVLARNPRGVALYLAMVAFSIPVMLVVPMLLGPEAELSPESFASSTIVTFSLVALLMTGNLSFDFRGDVDRMAVLKALPVSPLAVAAGQTLPAALFSALVQAIGLVALGFAFALPGPLVLAFLAVVPPASWAAVCIENAIFLLFPYRLVPEDPGDMGFVGRSMLVMATKLAALFTLALASGAWGFAIHWLTGSFAAAIAGVAVLLLALATALLALVSWAFRRFDVSRDVPL